MRAQTARQQNRVYRSDGFNTHIGTMHIQRQKYYTLCRKSQISFHVSM